MAFFTLFVTEICDVPLIRTLIVSLIRTLAQYHPLYRSTHSIGSNVYRLMEGTIQLHNELHSALPVYKLLSPLMASDVQTASTVVRDNPPSVTAVIGNRLLLTRCAGNGPGVAVT